MFAVVVLAGGAARRVGGVTKPALNVAGRSLISRVLDAVAQARPRIVVGPPELALMLPSGVSLIREHPPGGGPVAAIAAGLSLLPAADADSQLAVFAGDLPFLSPGAVSALLAAQPRGRTDPPLAGLGAGRADDAMVTGADDDGASPTHPADVAVLVDDAGRAQWLAGVWRLGSLADRLTVLGDPAGRSMRELTSGLTVAEVRHYGSRGPPAWFDCDTEDDLRRAEEWARGDIG